jgi:hypothetical protein
MHLHKFAIFKMLFFLSYICTRNLFYSLFFFILSHGGKRRCQSESTRVCAMRQVFLKLSKIVKFFAKEMF